MKHITTPILCLVLGLIMSLVILVDVSGATADSWDDDDDDRAYHQSSKWHYQSAHRGKGYGHKHKHRHRHKHSHKHQPGYWIEDAEYHEEICEDDDYDNRPVVIRPEAAAVWRNPPAPVEQPQRLSVPADAVSGAGPCREYYTTARIGGREQQIYGQACRQEDGSWKFEPNPD